MRKSEHKDQAQIVRELKEVHEKTESKNKDGSQFEEDTSSSDMTEQIKGSDADVDSAVKTKANSGESFQQQISGSDADHD